MTGPKKTRGKLNVEKYSRRLEEMKAQLESDLANDQQNEVAQDGGPEEPGPGQHWEHSGYGDHLADDATELFEREKLLGLETSLRGHLQQVERALKAIEAGTYGKCEVCGRPIGAYRLNAVPETTLCLEHKAAAERQAGAAPSAGS